MIRINGHLGAMVLSAFPAMAPRWHGAYTVLTGVLDGSALYGVLAEIEALGLDLLEIRKLTSNRESPGSGDSRLPCWQVLRAHPVTVTRRCRSQDPCPSHPARSLGDPLVLLKAAGSRQFGQRAKLQVYPNGAMLVGFGLDDQLREAVEVHCYCTTGYLITLRRAASPALDGLRQAGPSPRLAATRSGHCIQ